ncbi:MAG: PAS domain S-box protein [Pirellulales bacterium]|nr:PAS domain S-box protein [Pirellulales bacterium]
MTMPLGDISDLLRAIDAAEGVAEPTAPIEQVLRDWEPVLALAADQEGRILFRQTFDARRPSLSAEALAARLIEGLDGKRACALDVRGAAAAQLALGARLSGAASAVFVGALMRAPLRCLPPVTEGQTAMTLCGALAWAVGHNESRNAELHTRIRHLSDEQETLRLSHAEAITTAIEERERRLREQQEHMARIQAVMMMAAEGIITVDQDGMIESFNEAAGEIFQYAPAEAIGGSFTQLIPRPPDLDAEGCWIAALTADRAGAAGRGREVIGRRRDGTEFPLDLGVSEVLIDQRRIFTAIVRDITERKRAEQRLRRLHLQNEMILNSAGEGILGVDRQGSVIFANPAAARMLGWDPAGLPGRPLHATMHHSRADGSPFPAEGCPVCQPLTDAGHTQRGEATLWRKNGTSFPAEFVSAPIREGGRTTGAVVTFRDISEQRMLEAQLRQAQKLESIGQLAAGIAHEINTPTQYIGDNTRFVQDAFRDIQRVLDACRALVDAAARGNDPKPEIETLAARLDQADLDYLAGEIPHAIEQSLEGVERVAKIVHSMKEFSHPGVEEKQPFDINRAIESTTTVSRNEWKYVADLVTDLDPDLPLVQCLPGDLNQVILNLIVNAAHAIQDALTKTGQPKGTITITTRRDGDWVEIRVADTGTGVPEAIRGKLFDPFFTTKQVGRGTGQGLAIAHSVVTEKHGGTISFETQVGRGTTFIIRLPILPGA